MSDCNAIACNILYIAPRSPPVENQNPIDALKTQHTILSNLWKYIKMSACG